MFYYIRRGVEILSNQGLQALSQSSTSFFYNALGVKYNWYKYRLKYGSSIQKPSKLLWVSPSCIQYKFRPFFWKRLNTHVTHVQGGKWDTNRLEELPEDLNEQEPILFNIENWSYYTSMHDHFIKNKPWSETELYQKKDRQMEQGDLNNYFDKIELIYSSIKNNGYKTQKELSNSHHKNGKNWYHEIAINIGRDGTLMLDDGRHRFCISKIIGIEKVPVRVLVRHKKWQEILTEVHQANSIYELSKKARDNLQHPDITGIAKQKGLI